MNNALILKSFGLSALLIGASLSTADARIVRSGGQSEDSGNCDGEQTLGPVVNVVGEDGSTSASINLGDPGQVYALPDRPCNPQVNYEFFEDEDLEFFGSIGGSAASFYGASLSDQGIDAKFIWTLNDQPFGGTLGSFTFESETLDPTFTMPPELQIGSELRFSVRLVAMFTPSEGSAFFFCPDFSPCEPDEAVVTPQAYTFTAFTFLDILPSEVANSEVPIPGAGLFMLSALGGAAAWRRRTQKA